MSLNINVVIEVLLPQTKTCVMEEVCLSKLQLYLLTSVFLYFLKVRFYSQRFWPRLVFSFDFRVKNQDNVNLPQVPVVASQIVTTFNDICLVKLLMYHLEFFLLINLIIDGAVILVMRFSIMSSFKKIYFY